MAWDYKQETHKLQFEVSPMGWTRHSGNFPTYDSRLLLTSDFPELFNECWSAQFGDVCAVTSLYCFYFFSFNNCIFKLIQMIVFKKVKLLVCVMSGVFC